MKKLLLFLIFPFCISHINAGTYQEMLKPGNKWSVLYEFMPMCGMQLIYTTSLDLVGDTVIESKTYNKMRGILLSEDRDKNRFKDTIYAASLREDIQEQKIYIRYPGKGEELLYNFNVKMGDTLKVISDYTYVYGLLNKTIRFVGNVDTSTIAGIHGKKIIITDTLYYDTKLPDQIIHNKVGREVDVWCEGVGSLYGPIGLSTSNLPQRNFVRHNSKQCTPQNINANSDYYILLCFWNGSNFLYHNPYYYLSYNSCENAYSNLSDLENKLIENLSVYPNPTKGLVEIKSESGVELAELYDSIGNRIMTTIQNTLDLSSLSRGVYFVKVTTLSGKIKTVKIVKQ